MEIEPELVLALGMMPLHKSLQAAFTLESGSGQDPMNAIDVCKVTEDFIRASENITGMPSKIKIFPKSQTFVVEASPLLIRSLLDHGQGIVRKAALV
jgi:hypothetical protein